MKNNNILAHTYIIPFLLEIMERKDQETLKHSSRVQRIVNDLIPVLLKKEIIKEDDVPLLWVSAILHDIGKIFVDDLILESPKKLDHHEYETIKYHPVRGYRLLKQLDLPEEILLAIKHHHERWDGKTSGKYPGYPDGLKGERIPLFARIISVADAYDAMTGGRPYKPPMPPEKALKIIEENAGKQFDPIIAKIFVEAMREKIKKKGKK